MSNKTKSESSEERSDYDYEDFYMFSYDHIGATHTIYLTDEIPEPHKYVRLFQTLVSAGEEDIFNFRLHNYGGDLHTTIMLANCLYESRAKEINMIVMAPCYSGAALLALCGTSLSMRFGSMLMFHNYSKSGHIHSKGGEHLDDVVNHAMLYKAIFDELGAPFLTPEELEKLTNDGDVYIPYNRDGLDERIKKHMNDNAKLRKQARKK